jgi:monoamine oxidase
MSRSLISRLASRYSTPVSTIDRREFLRQSLALSAPLCLSSLPGNRYSREVAKRIVVIGAGFSGLACAHQLQHVGYDVTVIEARNRIGGRVFSSSVSKGNDYVKGRTVEFGGELVGSNHPIWVNYADRFGLEFLDLTEDEDAEMPVIIDGKRLSGIEAAQLWEELEKALNELNALAIAVDADAPWKSPEARKLDLMSVQTWIDDLDVSPLVKRAVWINLSADNGQDPIRQSLLGLLTTVKGGGVEKFWTESEVYRCKGGNDQLATKLAAAIGENHIHTKLAVCSVCCTDSTMMVETSDGRKFECDDVVLTAPPKTWPNITFCPALPRTLNIQTGFNAKYFAVVKDRFWEKHTPTLSQYALSDDRINMTWDGTDNQGPVEDGGACLVGFAGGSACRRASDMAPHQREAMFTEVFEQFFPGFRENFVKSFYMNWPKERWACASYSFPAPGEVTTVGPLIAEAHMGGHLHIAGEHACYKFVGFMEGALQSGVAVAKKIAKRDGVVN